VKLISWNVQWCRGMDGRVDPARIARAAQALCDPDVVCFQEVAENYATLAGSAGENQPALLASLFPGYSAHFACAVDVPDGGGGRRRFGNMLLSRLPVRQVFSHTLPWPPAANVQSMPRVALEAVVEAPWGLVSVVTTHLEYYSTEQRAAQVKRLCELQAERAVHSVTAPAKTYTPGPFEPFARPAASILTGDFNMRPGDPSMVKLREIWADTWSAAHPGAPHPPSFGVHDKAYASEPYCCDFVLVTPDLVPRLASVAIDRETRASDHQPVIVTFT
jgi:endonuclease/exonuclease/phosphatase family metal-dependent hydrolase